jgi:hypothetical protein
MTLPECVLDLYRRGKLPKQFRVADVRKQLEGEFSPNYIKTALANYAEDTGNYVKRWSKARFRRVKEGLYTIVG